MRITKQHVVSAITLTALLLAAGADRRQSRALAQAEIPGQGSKTFPETSKTVRGIFLDYWNGNGGLPQQGFPISEQMAEKSDLDGKSYAVQYFERAVFEYHPENQTPYNILLSQLGTFQYKAKYSAGAAGQKANNTAGSRLFAETGKRVGGNFLAYWEKNGGLAQQGYPISDEFTEKSDLDGKTYTVQYFERAVFEKHPENQPPFDVLLSQLGTFRYKTKYAASSQLPANISLTDFYEQSFLNLLLRDPESFTGVGLPDSYKPDFRHNKLTDVHDAYIKATYALANQYLEKLKSFDTKTQTPQQLVSTSILEWHLDDVTRGQEFMYHDYIINPATGVQNTVQDLMVNLQPLSNKQDAEDYVARLQDYGNKFDGVLEQLRLREQKGIIPPKWIIQSGLGQMQGFASQDAKQNELYVYFNTRLNQVSGLNASDKQALLVSAEKAIKEVVYPAYKRVTDYLATLVPKGRTTDGVWALPNGDAYYRYAIHHHTTTDMTPEEIHTLGLSEVARVREEMQAILDDLGYKGLSFAAAMDKVGDASGNYPTTTQAEKQIVVDAFTKLINDASTNVASQFDIKPKIGLEVRAVPVEKQGGSAGGFYFAPALDGSRPGIFYVNLGRHSFAKYAMPTLAYHEGVPGHHFQLGIQSELKGVPTFQRSGIFPSSTGYTEGWALYAEQLMYDAGFYKDDPYGNLGRLEAELFRSARLVVDTGIHWKHWTQAEANKYMEETLGTSPGSYAGEVARYISWPGQALGYKIGELKIDGLKKQAQQELGSKFNIKEFHNIVLQNGTVPLEVLETLVKGYIASKK